MRLAAEIVLGAEKVFGRQEVQDSRFTQLVSVSRKGGDVQKVVIENDREWPMKSAPCPEFLDNLTIVGKERHFLGNEFLARTRRPGWVIRIVVPLA